MNNETVHVVWHKQAVSRAKREALAGHKGCVIWFTGLSGCGKSTIANVLDHKLFELRKRSFLLDGDNVRHGLNASPTILEEQHSIEFASRFGLGFSPDDREDRCGGRELLRWLRAFHGGLLRQRAEPRAGVFSKPLSSGGGYVLARASLRRIHRRDRELAGKAVRFGTRLRCGCWCLRRKPGSRCAGRQRHDLESFLGEARRDDVSRFTFF